MRCSLLRWGVCSVILLAAYAASAYTFPDFDPFAAYQAFAQEEFEEEAATPTPTPTPSPDSEVLPTPSPTPEPTATASSREPTATATATSTAEAEPTPAPTRTPVPAEELPELTEERDEVGTVIEETVDVEGGRISSPDGRVTIDIPEDAADERLTFAITKREHRGLDPISTYSQFIAVWDFSATATDRDGAEVTSFSRPLMVTVRFSGEDLIWHNPKTLAYWTRHDVTAEWERVPSILDPRARTLTVEIDHFSEHGATADQLVNTAPLLDGRNTNLNSGSASLNIPLAVPPGRGGLTPQLNLSYDSGRLGEMRQYTSTSGWAGMGWALDVGSFSIDGDGRYWLNAGGFGGQVLFENGVLRLADEQFIQIVNDTCNFGGGAIKLPAGCQVSVVDKNGVKYAFGGDLNRSRWTLYYHCNIITGHCSWLRQGYRLDLASVEDTHGNRITYSYEQTLLRWPGCNGGGCDYVVSSYPKTIEYNHVGGDPSQPSLARVRFETSCDETPNSPAVCMREDTPRDYSCSTFKHYIAPPVLETRQLTRVTMDVYDDGWDTVRAYRFNYNENDPARHFHGIHQDSECIGYAGHHLLLSVEQRDRTDSMPLLVATFEYAPEPHEYYKNTLTTYYYTLPHLQEVNNGFGGIVKFDYEEMGIEDNRWTRSVVVSEVHEPGADQASITRTYDYGPGPDFQPYLHPTTSNMEPVHDLFNAEYRGFAEAAEVDAANNRTEYTFYTRGTYDESTGYWEDFEHEVFAGREYRTVFKDDSGEIWQRTDVSFGVRPLGGHWGGWLKPQYHYINFVYPEIVTQLLRDGTKLRTHYSFDDRGNLELIHDEGVTDSSNDDKYIYTPHHWNDGDTWLFAPKYELVTDRHPDDPTAAVLSRADFYYDGMNEVEPEPDPLNPFPTVGRLTATATQLNATEYSAVYMVHDEFGNVVRQSVPHSFRPDDYLLPSNPEHGWIPAGLPFSEVVFDPDHVTYPVEERGVIAGHVTTFDYDFVLGKPLSVEGPNGRVTELRYDNFGRLMKAWDDLDSEQHPTVSFTYNWGSVPNRTLTLTRTTHGVNETHLSVVCMDGFGREYQLMEHYLSILTNRTRIDYDARGMKVAETKAEPNGWGTTCPSSPTSVSASDRTVYSYDPLGNVVATMAVPANESIGPISTADHHGTIATFTDELLNTTTHVSDPAARTLTVIEPGTTTSTILRPDAQGQYAEWAFGFPSGPNYENVNEDTPDDDASYIHDGGWHKKDTHVYPGAGLPGTATVARVTLHFRWKHFDGSTPNPSNGMWAMFREADVDTLGPTYKRTNADGWGNDKWEMSVNPRTGQPWTVSDVNAGLEFGFQIYPAAGSAPYVTQAYVEVVAQEPDGPQTLYQYDRLGQLVAVTDDAGNVTTIQYDLAGRKTGMTDPDMGAWTYGYNVAGSLTSQTDARGITTTLQYDAAERLELKSYSNGDPAVGYEYDTYPDANLCDGAAPPLGLATRMSDGAGERLSCFDVRGREITTRRSVDSTAYDVHRTFHPTGDLASLTYPDEEVIEYSASQGKLYKVESQGHGTLVSMIQSTPWHATDLITLGNGLTTTYDYDFRGRVTNIETGGVQSVSLTYDDASNVKTLTDAVASEVASYTYDELHRLTGMSLDGASAASYTYNSIGNLLTKQEGASSLTLSYPSPGTPRPHAVTSVAGTETNTFKYDQNGNLAGTHGHSYEFDAENRLTGIFKSLPRDNPDTGIRCADINGDGVITQADIDFVSARSGANRSSALFDYRADLNWDGLISLTDVSIQAGHNGLACPSEETRYVYDGEGTLLKRSHHLPNQAATWTVYIEGIYEEQDDGTVVKYYHALGRAIAMRTVPASGPDELHYLLSDHLGSTTRLLNDQGGVVSEVKYWPYGATRSGGTAGTDKLYTGQQIEPSATGLGLYNYKARFYSTTLGRFVSADPVIPELSNRGLNRFAYAANNPVNFVDPSGHCFMGPGGAEYDCSPEAAQTWLRCFFVCSGALAKLAYHGVRSARFWGNVGSMFSRMEISETYGFVAKLAGTMIDHGTNAKYYLLPLRAFSIMTDYIYGAPYLLHPSFLRASIYDLAFGTSTILRLTNATIIGAFRWWGDAAHFSGEFWHWANRSDRFKANVPRLEDNLVWITVAHATSLHLLGENLDSFNWSSDQRAVLSTMFNVSPAQSRWTPPQCTGTGVIHCANELRRSFPIRHYPPPQ